MDSHEIPTANFENRLGDLPRNTVLWPASGITALPRFPWCSQEQRASSRTINMEVSTLRMIMKAGKLWSAIADDVRMLPERRDMGRALTPEEETKLLEACRRSPQPSLYTAVVIFCNTGLRNVELRRARWSQVDFMKAEFQVGKAKTAASEGRIVPLNQGGLTAFKSWRVRWPDVKPTDLHFPE